MSMLLSASITDSKPNLFCISNDIFVVQTSDCSVYKDANYYMLLLLFLLVGPVYDESDECCLW